MKKHWLIVLICAAFALASVGCGNQRGGANTKQRRVAAGTQTGTNIPRWIADSTPARDTRAKERARKAKREKREKKARAEKPKKERKERRRAADEEVITRGGFR